jgi:hypothetical protein
MITKYGELLTITPNLHSRPPRRETGDGVKGGQGICDQGRLECPTINEGKMIEKLIG